MNFLKAIFGNKEENEIEKSEEEAKKNFDILKYDGIRALKTHQVEYAIKCFSHALELQEDLEIRDYYSQALMNNNDLTGAYEQLQKLAEAKPRQVEIWIRMAEVANMMDNYGAMADACEKALMTDAENSQVYLLYGKACLGQGDQPNAIAMLTKAVMLKDDLYDAYLLRGQTYFEEGDIEAADEDALLLLKHLPDQEETLLLKAKIEKTRENANQAIEYFTKAIDANPFCLVAFEERGPLRQLLGDSVGADEDAKTAQELRDQLNSVSKQGYGGQDITQKVLQAYKDVDAYGIMGNS